MRWIMRTSARVFLAGRFRVIGLERIPRTGALLVCGNHNSTLDPPLVPSLMPRPDTWSMAKSEYFRHPLSALIFRWYHSFPVVRHSADRRALKRSFDLLAAGQCLIIYPEGFRVPDAVLHRPEPGAGYLALKSRAPILPVAVTGSENCLPKGRWLPRRTDVTVVFGEPFRIAERRPDGNRTSHQEAADAIMLRIAELLPDSYRGEFRDLSAWRARLRPLLLPAAGG